MSTICSSNRRIRKAGEEGAEAEGGPNDEGSHGGIPRSGPSFRRCPTVAVAVDLGLMPSQRPQVEVATGDRIQGTDAASLALLGRVREGPWWRGSAAATQLGFESSRRGKGEGAQSFPRGVERGAVSQLNGW